MIKNVSISMHRVSRSMTIVRGLALAVLAFFTFAAPASAQQRIVRIQQEATLRFLDAHEIKERDFQVVTRPFQNDNTQLWVLTDMGGGLHTIMQVSSGRFLDAHEIGSLDFRVVTRLRQNNNTQLWRLNNFGGGFHTIQQASNNRFLDAYGSQARDFSAVTRPATGSSAQSWRIVSP